MQICECARCGLRCYPAPLVCSRCHGTEMGWTEVREVTVLVTTRSPREDTALATVADDRGPRMIARVAADTLPGDRLDLVSSEAPGGAFVPPDPRQPSLD